MKKGYVPQQHGAWAMLILPFLFGMFAARPGPLHLLLFAVWLLSYLSAYPLLQWIRTGRRRAYQRPVLLYGSLLAAAGAALVAAEPGLARLAPLFAPLFLINVFYAKRNRERALVNDLAAVVQFSLIVFPAYAAGRGNDWGVAAELFGFSVLYFTGTVFYVKTIIREKGNANYYRLSVGYHLALLAAAALWHHPALLVPLAVLLIRAVWTPLANLPVRKSGMLEFGYSALTACTVLAMVAL
jgi:hypothetical protein